MTELQSAHDYDDRGAAAVVTVLLEIGQVLGTFRDRFVVIGGSVPWLLFPDANPKHVGTLDVDLSLDAEALTNSEYTGLIETLEKSGYERATVGLRAFQLRRTVTIDDGEPISVIVDLLMPKEAMLVRNRPPLLANFAVQRADGAAIAMRDYVEHTIEGVMPDGRRNAVSLRIASIPAFLVMKGYALAGRNKRKDAYDIYFAVREFAGGPDALANACRHLLADPVARVGYQHIAGKFTADDAFGPRTVRIFLEESSALGDMTPAQVQLDAFMQVKRWLLGLGL
ncbi:MAG: hypothetical protein IPM01_28440 [Burkholderiaceae bacterium]|nr:hypothetical protein [Burkholderiaceae bacterium]